MPLARSVHHHDPPVRVCPNAFDAWASPIASRVRMNPEKAGRAEAYVRRGALRLLYRRGDRVMVLGSASEVDFSVHPLRGVMCGQTLLCVAHGQAHLVGCFVFPSF